jgi:hypothetical protein
VEKSVMMTALKTLHKNRWRLLGSKQFWLCFIGGWTCFTYVNSLRAYYYGGSFYEAIINTIQVGIFASITLLWFRFHYFHRARGRLHPMALIPVLCMIALAFGAIVSSFTFLANTELTFLAFFNGIFIEPNSTSWFGQLVGYFTTQFYVILHFLMVYVFIQSERSSGNTKTSISNVLLAIASLVLVQEFLHIISTIAYYNPPGYLFSFYYYWSFSAATVFGFALSSYVFFMKPTEELAGSRFLPQLPMFTMLVFCSSVFSMWLFIITPYLYEMFKSTSIRDMPSFILRVYSQHVPLWGTAEEFSGLLQSKFNENITAAFLLLYCNFSKIWGVKSVLINQQQFDIRRAAQFWSYNIGGWSIAALYLYFSDLLDLNNTGNSISQIFIFSFIVVGVFLSALLRSLIRRVQLANSSLVSFTYKIVVISVLFSVLQAFALTMTTYIYVYGVLGHEALKDIQQIFSGSYYFLKSLTWFSLCFIVWSLIYHASISQRQKSENVLKQLQLEKNMKEIQLNTLAGKLDPHFIFNSLNNIRSLIREDAEKARDAVLILSDILRSPIARSAQDKVQISEEMLLVRHYIALSKLQLEHRLNYQEVVADIAKIALIPPMMLQILVENAIKHGISQLTEGGNLIVTVTTNGSDLICHVSNSGSLSIQPGTQGFGIGVNNIKDRIALLYGDKAQFALSEKEGIVTAELKLPLQYQNNKGALE